MFRSITMVIVSVVLCGWTKAAAEENPELTVFVYNDAGVDEVVLKPAEEITERIYQQAGVAILWRKCTGAVSPEYEECSHTERVTGFSVRIVARALHLPDEDFGIAFVGSDGLGQQADIFYSGIERLERKSSVEAAKVLGYVMAHELGHLLLGMKSHSSVGIMQARWGDNQLRQISLGTLRFDKRQSDVMKSRLVGPYAAMRIEEKTSETASLTRASSPPE